MKRFVRPSIATGSFLLILIGGSQAHTFSPDLADQPAFDFSPLFERRLEVSISNLDGSPERVHMAILPPMMREDPPESPIPETPASGNPLSVCVASVCLGSVCLGSVCVTSQCVSSGCVNSACVLSGCTSSGCAGSVCAGSACAGSVCFGSGCVGSVCAGTGCLGSACTRCTSEGRDGRRLG